MDLSLHNRPIEPSKGSVTVHIEGARRGVAGAFDAIYLRYRKEVLKYAKRLARNKDGSRDYEDLCDETFIDLMELLRRRKADGIRNRVELKKFLIHLIRWKACKLLRKEAAAKAGGDWKRTPQLAELLADRFGPEDRAAFEDDCRKLFELLPNEKSREIVRRHIECYSVDEIAESMGVGLSTVYRKIAIARNLVIQHGLFGFGT